MKTGFLNARRIALVAFVGFASLTNSAFAGTVTVPLSTLFPTESPTVLNAFSSSQVMTSQTEYQNIYTNCRTYSNPPASCTNRVVFGLVPPSKATADTYRGMNRMTVVDTRGQRRWVNVSVQSGNLVYDDAVLRENEIGIIDVSYFRSFPDAPFSRCTAELVVCSAKSARCPKPSHEPLCTSVSTTSGGAAPCDAGQTGPDGGPCVACLDTEYKPTQGPAACTACSAPTPANSVPGSVVWSTAGTTKSSANDCIIQDFSCSAGFTKNLATKTCDANCALSLAAGVITPPTILGATDGSFSVATSGAVGTVTYSVSPNTVTAGPSSNSGASYSGAAAGNYAVIATDSGVAACTKNVSITVPAGASCSVTASTAGSGQYLTCAYSCGTDTYGIGTRSIEAPTGATCSSPSTLAGLSGTGCGSPTPTSCSIGSGSSAYTRCASLTCPLPTQTRVKCWDAGCQGDWTIGTSSAAICSLSNGADVYSICTTNASPAGSMPVGPCLVHGDMYWGRMQGSPAAPLCTQ